MQHIVQQWQQRHSATAVVPQCSSATALQCCLMPEVFKVSPQYEHYHCTQARQKKCVGQLHHLLQRTLRIKAASYFNKPVTTSCVSSMVQQLVLQGALRG
jgi:hypothetical protein